MLFAMISPGDMVIVVGVALVVFGPKRLPEVARQLGSFVREARSMMSHVTDQFEDISRDVHSSGFSGDNVMRPRPPGSSPALAPFDQRENYTPPVTPSKIDSDATTTEAAEPVPNLRLTDVSTPQHLPAVHPAAESGAMEPHAVHEPLSAGVAVAQPHEVNKL